MGRLWSYGAMISFFRGLRGYFFRELKGLIFFRELKGYREAKGV